MQSLTDIPKELFYLVCDLLAEKDLAALSQVCKQFKLSLDAARPWEYQNKIRFGMFASMPEGAKQAYQIFYFISKGLEAKKQQDEKGSAAFFEKATNLISDYLSKQNLIAIQMTEPRTISHLIEAAQYWETLVALVGDKTPPYLQELVVSIKGFTNKTNQFVRSQKTVGKETTGFFVAKTKIFNEFLQKHAATLVDAKTPSVQENFKEEESPFTLQ